MEITNDKVLDCLTGLIIVNNKDSKIVAAGFKPPYLYLYEWFNFLKYL